MKMHCWFFFLRDAILISWSEWGGELVFYEKLFFYFQISALHHSRNPCERNTSYLQNNCFIDCFMKRLAHENITCRLPYMSGKQIFNFHFSLKEKGIFSTFFKALLSKDLKKHFRVEHCVWKSLKCLKNHLLFFEIP